MWFCGIKSAGDKAAVRERHSSSTELKRIGADFSLRRATIIEQSYAKCDFYLAILEECFCRMLYFKNTIEETSLLFSW